jgi:hypothetical protein
MANESKRFTPKKSNLPNTKVGTTGGSDGASAPASAGTQSGRYTPRSAPRAATSAESLDSPPWVAWLMFLFFGIGLLIIVINYTNIAWETNNWALVAGLVSIVVGFLTATKLR